MNSYRISFPRIAAALVAVLLLASPALAQTRGSGRGTLRRGAGIRRANFE